MFGYYSYTAPTADGVFYTANVIENFGFPPDTNESLGGSLPLTLPLQPVQYDSGLGTEDVGTLTVSGDQVTDFEWEMDYGGVFTVYSGNGFYSESYDDPSLDYPDGVYPDNEVIGSTDFSTPTVIPDAYPTATMLLLAVAGCFIGRAWIGSKATGPLFTRKICSARFCFSSPAHCRPSPIKT